jgi:hypothetical protein
MARLRWEYRRSCVAASLRDRYRLEDGGGQETRTALEAPVRRPGSWARRSSSPNPLPQRLIGPISALAPPEERSCAPRYAILASTRSSSAPGKGRWRSGPPGGADPRACGAARRPCRRGARRDSCPGEIARLLPTDVDPRASRFPSDGRHLRRAGASDPRLRGVSCATGAEARCK